jgi:UDP-N-acetylmuramyl tripeptide synthase
MMEKEILQVLKVHNNIERSYCRICCFRNCKGGILRSGLGFSICDIGIITNIQEDHLGISDIHSLEDLAKVKATVVKPSKDGWAI